MVKKLIAINFNCIITFYISGEFFHLPSQIVTFLECVLVHTSMNQYQNYIFVTRFEVK